VSLVVVVSFGSQRNTKSGAAAMCVVSIPSSGSGLRKVSKDFLVFFNALLSAVLSTTKMKPSINK